MLTTFSLVLALLPHAQVPEKFTPDVFVSNLEAAVRTAKFEALNPFFVSPGYANYVREMVGRAENLQKIGVSAFPAPPGLERMGSPWMVFHKYQMLEADHDPVHPFASTGDGPKLGAELPEDLYIPFRIQKLSILAKLYPSDSRAQFSTTAEIRRTGSGPATVLMRINSAYIIKEAKYKGLNIPIFDNAPVAAITLSKANPELVRAGSILYLTNAGDGGVLQLEYSTSVNEFGGDQIVPDQALITSYWYPHIGRQPSKTEITVEGPKAWLLLSNGNKLAEKEIGDRKSVSFKNELSVSFHHIVGGPYKLAAKIEDRGREIRAWHLGTPDFPRAEKDVASARDAIAFFEDRFGKYPYEGYDIVDTPRFYGVECYSFTVLSPRITSWATSHEIGHTWFGWIVPNTYIHSIWNESITQYADSVLHKQSSDKTLERGYELRKQSVSLTQSFTAHGPFGNVGYYRGAFTLKMLESEIGEKAMMDGLKSLLDTYKGRAIEWNEIESIFKQKNNVGWFFDQWVRNSKFPTIAIQKQILEPGSRGGFNTSVRFSQSGTERPYRLRFEVILTTPKGKQTFPITMTQQVEQFNLETQEKPTKLAVNPIGFTLADVPPEVELK